MSNRLRWVAVAAVLVVAAALAVWFRGGPATAGSSPAAAPVAPAVSAAARASAALQPCPVAPATPTGSPLAGVSVTCLGTGASVDLGRVLAGGPVLVNVWASWCPPCQAELPALASYAATPGAIRVLGVQVQSDQQDGLSLLTGLGVHLPTVFDGSGAASRALKLPEGLPVSYVVSATGTATLIGNPRVFTSVDQITGAVRDYLGTGAG
ncbi:MAG TPA: TlpA disulfide reductase family protein [Pseudonocardiaceae bacterium]|jgi:thiol-disulfide isomerase/thioredoxin|nr:TlpA disulfide reductase family protein [Pseudonocardiaceae bacterium]